ncbi:MAG: hypothetical protein U0930_00615 [Pirellulales bacterium]
MTISEQFKLNDLAVIATLVSAPEDLPGKGELPIRKFKIRRILKGEAFIEEGESFSAVLKGDHQKGAEFLVWGAGPPEILWSEPIPSHARLEEYLDDIQDLPEKGRLAFFQDFFEDPLKVLASDAYDEFAVASYEDLRAIKNQMPRERLMSLIVDPNIEENRCRLYLTMLGICGKPEDIATLERLLTSTDPKECRALDALVACYLCLKGSAGLPLIEKQFLAQVDADYSKVQQVVAALRFHGTEVDMVGRKHLIETVRKLLDRPRLADSVIPDLARWEDWSVMDQLVEMFKKSTKETIWVRVPIFKYLNACPLPSAKERIEELKQIDSGAYDQAMFLSRIKLSAEEGSESESSSPEPK